MRSMMRDSLLYFFINEILLFIFSLSFLKYNHMLGEKNGKIALNSLKRDTTRKDFIRLLRRRKKEKKTLETRQLDTVYTRPSRI